MRTRLIGVLSICCLWNCGAGGTAPAPDTFTSAHFTFRHTALDRANIAAIADSVERQYARIVADLAPDSMPRVTVTFYADHAAMEAATAPVAGVVPSWATGLATSAEQIHLMSPNLPAFAPVERMITNLVHEFAHCVSLRINRRIANNPRWLWESVAMYEARQFVDPRTLPYMTAGTPPSFAALSAIDNTRVYDVGYTIAEFIVSRGGGAALTGLVANNGDVQATLGMSTAELEQGWFRFVRDRYLGGK